MAFNSTLQAALEGDIVSLFFAVYIDHPEKTIRLLDGAGVLTFDSNTWLGHDPDIGALGALEVIEDQAERSEAPEVQIIIRPETTALIADLAAPAAHGAAMRIYMGAYSATTGLVIGDPEVIFYGLIDEIDTVVDRTTTSVTFTCVSDFVRFQAEDEAMTLSTSFHESVWSGEYGLRFMTDVEQQMPWGVEGQRPSVITVGS